MKQDDITYLQNLRNDRWKNSETTITVGRILVDYDILNSPDLALDFMERPQNWQQSISELIEEWNDA